MPPCARCISRGLRCVPASGRSTSCMVCRGARVRCVRPNKRVEMESPVPARKRVRMESEGSGVPQEEAEMGRLVAHIAGSLAEISEATRSLVALLGPILAPATRVEDTSRTDAGGTAEEEAEANAMVDQLSEDQDNGMEGGSKIERTTLLPVPPSFRFNM
ncbi:uncharacterized protein EI90DRAFT_3086777 [Cantharellus anzutake]|uniref:uncharacterized protein n=1 Tax=Cantharellus anzutake TaxID=1750568 RepID=UPI0019075B2B|nr:uncharacterized protein EI90DRAFT_3086777 [Cantharellus anzutake]KAF8316262.1 hypothetical protein EI90DRAFT_3086777 [Cantharellus anzutake]